MIKPAGPDCNIACKYCFYLEKEKLFPTGGAHRMSTDVLEATVRQVMVGKAPNVSFGWQGGEPTLMGVDFFKKAFELEERFGQSGQVVGNGLQTNGLLIDDEWCNFLREAKFLVGLSIDGPKEIHDHYRVTRGQKPTWTRVNDALKRMLDAEVEVNALTVLNDLSAEHPDEIYDFLKGSGLTYFQFIPCIERDPADPTRVAPFSVSPEQYGAFLCRIFDRWHEDFIDGIPSTVVRWFDSVFATYVGVPPPECTLLTECGSYVVVEHNGDVFSCDFYVEDDWKLGNVMAGDLRDLLNSQQQTRFGHVKAELPDACRECRWLRHCRGGCPRERLSGPNGNGVSYFCEGYKMFFAHADERYRQLAQSWVRQQGEQACTVSRSSAGAQSTAKAGRNDPCPCGSGHKYKRCCGR